MSGGAGRSSQAGIRPDQEAPSAARVTSEAATSNLPRIVLQREKFRVVYERDQLGEHGELVPILAVEWKHGEDAMGQTRWQVIGSKDLHGQWNHIAMLLIDETVFKQEQL